MHFDVIKYSIFLPVPWDFWKCKHERHHFLTHSSEWGIIAWIFITVKNQYFRCKFFFANRLCRLKNRKIFPYKGHIKSWGEVSMFIGVALIVTRNIVKSPTRNCVIFNNENFAKTYIARNKSESLKERHERGMVAGWLCCCLLTRLQQCWKRHNITKSTFWGILQYNHCSSDILLNAIFHSDKARCRNHFNIWGAIPGSPGWEQ